MNEEEALKLLKLKPQMWKIGKSTGEQLWMREYTVWYIFKKLTDLKIFPQLEKEKQELLEISCLVHDLKKGTPWNQMILSSEADSDKIINKYVDWWAKKSVRIDEKEFNLRNRLFKSGRTDHQIETERDYEYFLKPDLELAARGEKLAFENTEEKSRAIFDIIKHHFIKEEDISKSALAGLGNYILLLKHCDHLASMEDIDARTINEFRKINKFGRQIFDLTYFTVSREFGPSTALIFDELLKAYKKKGWTPLLYFEDGVVFVSKDKKEALNKEEFIKHMSEHFTIKYLESSPVQYRRETLLVGIAKDHPQKFLVAHKDRIVGDLDRSEAGSTFFKILMELLTNGGYKNERIRKEYPVLDVLFGLTGGTRGIPLAGKKWKEDKNEDLPKQENGKVDKRASINYIFNSVSLEEVVPKELCNKISATTSALNKYSSEELFRILDEIADVFDQKTERDKGIKQYLKDIISLEEEKDFREIVRKRFEEYKKYKRKPSEKEGGVCDICGCTVTQRPSSDFVDIQTFTQTKAEPRVPRKVCPFCDYDNSVMRQGLGNYVPINARMHSKIPLKFRDQIKEIINALKNGLNRIQEIENLEKKWGFLLPPVDVFTGESEYEVTDIVSVEDGIGSIFRLERKNKKGFSPKDYRVKYEPLYHVLNLLGFNISIGAEEQYGLFGEDVITKEEDYNKSLAVILLSSTLYFRQENKKKFKQKRYIFAKELLEKSPSVAIRYAFAEERIRGKNKSELKMDEKLTPKFFDFLYKSGIMLFRIKWGEYRMKDLLKDAAFFADRDWGIPHFCVELKERKEWSKTENITRHKAAKPVSDALNEMLKGGDEGAFERAVAAFMRNLAKKIGEEERDTQKEFVKRSADILEKFWELRKADISEFIRAKNALTSTIFVFTRYENLKEVIKNE